MTRHNTTPTQLTDTDNLAIQQFVYDWAQPSRRGEMAFALADFLAARGNNTTHEALHALADEWDACDENGFPLREGSLGEAADELRAALSPAPTDKEP